MKIHTLHLGSPYHTDLVYSKSVDAPSGETFVRLESFLSVSTRAGVIVVPKHFRSDGASIPWVARPIVGCPFDLEFLADAIVHDFLYRDNGLHSDISRRQADKIFRDLLWNTKVPKWKIPPFYSAVLLAGWKSYKKIKTL